MDKELVVMGGLTVLFVVIIFVVAVWVFSIPTPAACDKSKPTAGDIVSCIATRTAEAKNK